MSLAILALLPLAMLCGCPDDVDQKQEAGRKPYTIDGGITHLGGPLPGIAVSFLGQGAPEPCATGAGGLFLQNGFPGGVFSVVPSNASYDFYVPNPAFVRTEDLLTSASVDASTNPSVSFLAVPAGSAIDLWNPNGGESFLIGETVNVTWRSAVLVGTTVRLDWYGTDFNWHEIATGIANPPNPAGNSYGWYIDPAHAEIDTIKWAQVRVRITSEDYPDVLKDQSDGTITVGNSASLVGFAETPGGDPITGIQFQFMPQGGSPSPPSMAAFDIIRATADSGTQTTLVDASIVADAFLSPPYDVDFVDMSMLIVNGTNKDESSPITAFDSGTGTFTLAPGFSANIQNDSVYEISCGRFLQHGWKPGTYDVTPQKAGFTFAPPMQTIVINAGDTLVPLPVPFVGTPSGASLTLLRPEANEELVVGTAYKIRWEQTALDGTQITIEYDDENPGGYVPLAAISPADAGVREAWWTPTAGAASAYIRITSLVDGTLQDEVLSPGFSVVNHQTISGTVTHAIDGTGVGDVLVSFTGGNNPPGVRTNTGAPVGDYSRDSVTPSTYTVSANKTGLEFRSVLAATGGTTTSLQDAAFTDFGAAVIGSYVTFVSPGPNQGYSRRITASVAGPPAVIGWAEPLPVAVTGELYTIHHPSLSSASVTVTAGSDVTGVDFLAFPAGAGVQLNHPSSGTGTTLGPWYLGQEQELSATTLNLNGRNLIFEYSVGGGAWVQINPAPVAISSVTTTYTWAVDIADEEIPALEAAGRAMRIRARVQELSLYQDVSDPIDVDGGYRILGWITADGSISGAVDNVDVQFLGEEAPSSATTDASGFYVAGAFTPGKAYTVTPSRASWKFGSAGEDETARETSDFPQQVSFTATSSNLQGTATGGDTLRLVDTTISILSVLPDDSLNDAILEILSGPDTGEKRRITAYTQASQEMQFSPALSSSASGVDYRVLVRVANFLAAPQSFAFSLAGAQGEPVSPPAYPKLAWIYTKEYAGGVQWQAEDGTNNDGRTLNGTNAELQFSANGGGDWEAAPIPTPDGTAVSSAVGPTPNALKVRIDDAAPFLVSTNLGQVRIVSAEYRLIRTSFSGPITVPKVTEHRFEVVRAQNLAPIDDYTIALETLIAMGTDIYQPTIDPTGASGQAGRTSVLLMDGFYNFKPLDDPGRNMAATQSSDPDYKFPGRYLYKSVNNTANHTVTPIVRFIVQPRAWPQIGYGDAKTHQPAYAGTQGQGTRWDFTSLDDRPAGPAAVEADGSTYFITEDQFLYALDRSGKQRWRVYLEDPGDPNNTLISPQIALDGSVLVYNNGYLEAIDPEDGSDRWSVYGNEYRPPLIARDGRLYMYYEENSLSFGFAARDVDGSDIWTRHFDYSSPEVAAETASGVQVGSEYTTLVDADLVWPADVPTDSAAWLGGMLVIEKGTKSYLRHITGYDDATKTFSFEPPLGSVVGTVTDNRSDYGKPPWRADQWHQVGDLMAPAVNPGRWIFECTATVGTNRSDMVEPAWNFGAGLTTNDNDVTWTCQYQAEDNFFIDGAQADLADGASGTLHFTTGRYYGLSAAFTNFELATGTFTLAAAWPELTDGESEDSDSYVVIQTGDEVLPGDTYSAFRSFFQAAGPPIWGPQDLVFNMRRMDMPLAGLFSDFSEARFRRIWLSGMERTRGDMVVNITLPDAIGPAEGYIWRGVPTVTVGNRLYLGYPVYDHTAVEEYRWHIIAYDVGAGPTYTPSQAFDELADDDDGTFHTVHPDRGQMMAYSPMNGGTLFWPGRGAPPPSEGGYLRGLSPVDGLELWTIPLRGVFNDTGNLHTPAVDNLGNAYVSSTDRRLYRVEKAGAWGDYTPWQSATAYQTGDEVVPTLLNANGFIYRCVVAGTSDGAEPGWTTPLGNITAETTVQWVCVAETGKAKVSAGWPHITGTGGDVSTAPVIGPDGTAYIGGQGDVSTDYYFRAVTDIGTPRWTVSFPAEDLVSLDMHKENGNEYVYGLGHLGRIEKYDVTNGVFLSNPSWPEAAGGWNFIGVSQQQILLHSYGALPTMQFVHLIDNQAQVWSARASDSAQTLLYWPDVTKSWKKTYGGPAVDAANNLYMTGELDQSPWGGRLFKLAPSGLPGESLYNLTWPMEGGPYFDKWGNTALFEGTPVVDEITGFIYVCSGDDLFVVDGADGTLAWAAYGIKPNEVRPALDNAAGFRRLYARAGAGLYAFDSYMGRLHHKQDVEGDWAFGERQQVIISTEAETLSRTSDTIGSPDGTTLVESGCPAGSYVGQMLWITSGPLAGQCRMINSFAAGTGTFTVETPFGLEGHLGVKGSFAPLDSGTLTAPLVHQSTTLIEDGTKSWAVDQFAGERLLFRSGPSAGEDADILSNDATTITLMWSRNAGAGDRYEIVEREHDAFTDRTRVEPDDFFNNWEMYIYSGTNAGDGGQIADYTGSTGTFWTMGFGEKSDSSTRYSACPPSGSVFYDDDLPQTTRGAVPAGPVLPLDQVRTDIGAIPGYSDNNWRLVMTGGGANRGQERTITGYAGGVFTLDSNLPQAAALGETHYVYRTDVDYTGRTIVFLTAGNAGESRTITAYDPDGGRGQITLDSPLPAPVVAHKARFIIPVAVPSGTAYKVIPMTAYVTAGKDVLALAPAVNGVTKWRATLDSDLNSRPALIYDADPLAGRLYVLSRDGLLSALDLSGSVRWTTDTGGTNNSSFVPLVGDNDIIVGNDAGSIMGFKR